jgi:hypothetical protein
MQSDIQLHVSWPGSATADASAESAAGTGCGQPPIPMVLTNWSLGRRMHAAASDLQSCARDIVGQKPGVTVGASSTCMVPSSFRRAISITGTGSTGSFLHACRLFSGGLPTIGPGLLRQPHGSRCIGREPRPNFWTALPSKSGERSERARVGRRDGRSATRPRTYVGTSETPSYRQ